MKIKFYQNNTHTKSGFTAGITLKDKTEPENGNIALHICDSQDAVLQNRQGLAQDLGIGLDDFACPTQTHSDNFYQVTPADRGRGAKDLATAILDTDALFTYEPNLFLACFTADCVPLIFHNDKDGLVGVIHSGWQGTVKKITTKVFHHLIQEKGHKPTDFQIYIGPAISQDKFEVDQDVLVLFQALDFDTSPFIYYKKETDKYHIDNKAVVKTQCQLLGIPSDNIFVDPTCTYLDKDCFSYRRERQTGRHLSFAIRQSP